MTTFNSLIGTIVNGLGPKGGRNNALASFVGALLYRGVDPVAVAKLARLANSKTADPLPLKEVDRTTLSIIDKEFSRREKQGLGR